MVDVGVLVPEIVPYVSAVAAAYGGAVVQKVTDAAGDAGADATVSLGSRLLRRLFASDRAEQVRAAVVEVGEQPDDEASVAVLRAQVLKAVSQDPRLAEELAAMVREAGDGDRYTVNITGGHGFQVGSNNTQTNTFSPPPPPPP